MLEKLKLLRNHGIKFEEQVMIPGTNAKMNEFQAALGLCNLKYVDQKIQRRKELCDKYKERLSGCVMLQKTISSRHNFGYMPVCFENAAKRDEIFTELVKNAIRPRKYFFPLTTDSDYFKKKEMDLVKKYSLKNARDISNRILCLPLYPDLRMEDANRVIEIVRGKLDAK